MPFSFGRLATAQADGDAEVLSGLGRPMLRVHRQDRAAGWDQLLAATGVQE